jgi:putrescine transport system ATP-binding protein
MPARIMAIEAANPFLRIEKATRRFGAVTAVDDVSLALARGEFFCLLGASGCGKTTLMRLVAGFERSDAGRIILDGQDITALPPHRRPVNMMFQSYALFPHLSVRRNIAFGLEQAGATRADIDERCDELLALLKLAPLADRKPDALSGGQKQRVALARALARRPALLLLDEPLGALDKKLREETQVELKAIQAQLDMTFLVVTHDQDEALGLADRIAVMDHGRIVQIGTPAQIYARPEHMAVAQLVGDMSSVPATVTRVADGVAEFKAAALGGATLRAPAAPGLAPGEARWIIRPEHVEVLVTAADARSGLSLPAEIVGQVYRGDQRMVHARLKSGPNLLLRLAGDDVSLGVGQGVILRLDPMAGRVLAL